MTTNEIIWTMWFYIGVQYFFSRHVANFLNREDPDYFDLKTSDGKLPFGMKTSLAITQMMFDTDLPGAGYSKSLKNKIYAARVIFILTIPLLIMLLYI